MTFPSLDNEDYRYASLQVSRLGILALAKAKMDDQDDTFFDHMKQIAEDPIGGDEYMWLLESAILEIIALTHTLAHATGMDPHLYHIAMIGVTQQEIENLNLDQISD